ncbi:MAG: hypothetical protein HYX51_10245 [Chloroflexi bacterium]|nr:hypothetical protein [Chloroflexota bacterium]
MTYEVWDTDTANLVGSYSTEDAALKLVRDTVAASGETRVLTWALAREDRRGKTTTLAVGHDLIAQAHLRPNVATG